MPPFPRSRSRHEPVEQIKVRGIKRRMGVRWTRLTFNPYYPEVKPVLDEIHRRRPEMGLSQMSDTYTSAIVLGCAIEVKVSGGGDYNEVVMQRGIWCAAGLEKRWSMVDKEAIQLMKPLWQQSAMNG